MKNLILSALLLLPATLFAQSSGLPAPVAGTVGNCVKIGTGNVPADNGSACASGGGGTSVSQNSGSAETNLPITGFMPQVCSDTSASGTAQSCTVANSFTPQSGNCIVYKTTTTNSGTGLTVNVNSLGAKSVAVAGSSGWTTTLVASSSIPANKPMNLCYDGTNWDASGTGYVPASGGGSVTINGGSSLGTANFNGTTPAAPTGTTNVAMQVSGSNVSGNVPILTSSLPQPAALGSWTWMNQGTATTSNNSGMLAMTIVDGSSLNWRVLTQTTASTPYSYAFYWKSLQFFASSVTTGIYLTDGTKLLGLEVLTQVGAKTLRVERLNSVTSDNSTVKSSSLTNGFISDPLTGGLYGRLRNDGTTLYVDISPDGVNWTNYYSEAVGAFLTPNAVGFGGVCITSGTVPYAVNSLQGFLYTASGSL